VATSAVHTFVGGRVVARPLLADDSLPRASKWLNYYCWHIATVTILLIAAGFGWLAQTNAWTPAHMAVLSALTAFTTALSALSAFVARKGGINPLRFPSTSLFAMIALTGLAMIIVSG